MEIDARTIRILVTLDSQADFPIGLPDNRCGRDVDEEWQWSSDMDPELSDLAFPASSPP